MARKQPRQLEISLGRGWGDRRPGAGRKPGRILVRDEGWQHARARFDSVPAIVRPLVRNAVRGRVKKMLWTQGVLRHSHEDIVASALRDWCAVLAVMSDGPFFFGDEPPGLDAIVFGALAASVLTPI
jgi:hypothetical protein